MTRRRFLHALIVLLILVTPSLTAGPRRLPPRPPRTNPAYVATDLGDWTPEAINNAGSSSARCGRRAACMRRSGAMVNSPTSARCRIVARRGNRGREHRGSGRR